MDAALGILHGVIFLLTCLLVGSLIFTACIAPASGQSQKLLFQAKRRELQFILTLLLIVSLIWLVFVCAEMAESWNPSDLLSVLTGTYFGHRACLQLLVVLLLTGISSTQRMHQLWWLALVLPLGFSLTGHAGADDTQSLLNLPVDYLHLISVSIWTGGLFALFSWLGLAVKDPSRFGWSYPVTQRFSHFAMVSTGVIAVTGVILAWRYGVSLTRPWGSDYGLLVLAKTGLFSLALLAAAVNQFLHIRNYRPGSERDFTLKLRREVSLEMTAVILIFGVAGFLTRLSPPGHS
jgi:putative copper export protein